MAEAKSKATSGQDPRKLRKLLEILREYGVVKYDSSELSVELSGGNMGFDTTMGALGTGLEQEGIAPTGFSMEDYVSREPDNVKSINELTDQEVLEWSIGG